MLPVLAAESARLDTMVELFLIALVVVSPAAVVVVRRILRSRRAPTPPAGRDPGEDPGGGDAAADAGPLGELATLVARLDAIARDDRRAGPGVDGAAWEVAVEVRAELAAALRPGGPERSAVERLVLDDATRRSGLRLEWGPPRTDGPTVVVVRPAEAGSNPRRSGPTTG